MLKINWQTIRFIIIGVSGALIYLLVSFALMNTLHLQAYLASLLAYATSFSFAYLGQKIWAFRSMAPHSRTLTRYGLLQIFCATFAAIFSQFAADQGKLSALAVSTLASFLTSIISYFASTYWVFAEPSQSNEAESHSIDAFIKPITCSINTKWFLITVILVFSALKLWLISEFANYAEAFAGHDDQHFVSQAINVIQGRWLGTYNQFTLIKGPAFPFWLVLLYHLQIPLITGQTILYILACIGLTLAIKNGTQSYAIAALSFIILVLYLDTISRVIREGLYIPITLGIFALLALCHQHSTGKLWQLLGYSSLLGCALAIFWMTREEGVWLVPSITLCLAFSIYTLVSNPLLTRRYRAFRISILLLPFIIAGFSVTVIKIINERHYQSYNVVDMNDSSYVGAYGSLARVVPPQKIPYVPITKATRHIIYSVSPSFQLLKPFLEGSKWDNSGCTLYTATCGEIAGGWFMWALRDAVAAAGFYRDGKTTQNYYQQLKNEIDTACDQNKLKCLPERNTLLPVMDKTDLLRIWKSCFQGANSLFSASILSFEVLSAQFIRGSVGDQYGVDYFKAAVVGEIAPLENSPSFQNYLDEKNNTAQYIWNARISHIYVLLWPLLLISALLLYGFSLYSHYHNRQLDFTLVFTTALIVAVCIRIVILAIIDATSFPGINEVYMSPAFPLTLAFILFCHIEGYYLLSRVYRQIQDRSQETGNDGLKTYNQ